MSALAILPHAATMSSREIAELTGKEHKNVLADVRKMLSDLGKATAEFSAVASVPGSNGSTRTVEVFNLPKRESLILVSGYSVTMRAKIIDRWQELEAGAPAALDLRQPAQLLAVAAQLTQMCQEQQAQLAAQAPKVQFAEAVAAADADQKLAVVAKAIGAGPRKLLQFLKDRGVLMRNGLPFQQHIDRGRFRVIEVPFKDLEGKDRVRPETRVTGRGITFVQQLVSRDGGAAHA